MSQLPITNFFIDQGDRYIGEKDANNTNVVPSLQYILVGGLFVPVSIANPMPATVGNFPATQTVAGTIGVNSLPTLPAGTNKIGAVDASITGRNLIQAWVPIITNQLIAAGATLDVNVDVSLAATMFTLSIRNPDAKSFDFSFSYMTGDGSWATLIGLQAASVFAAWVSNQQPLQSPTISVHIKNNDAAAHLFSAWVLPIK